jgi:hypothetical protein
VFVGVDVGVADGEDVGLGVQVGSTPYWRKVVSTKAHPNKRQQHRVIAVIGIARSMNFCFPVIELFIATYLFLAGAAAFHEIARADLSAAFAWAAPALPAAKLATP